MTDDREVTIRITADTTGYKDGVADATKANKDFEAQTSKIGQRMRESWDKVGEKIGLSTKKASDGMKGSKIGESFKSALGGKGLMDVLKLALKGVIAGVITAAAVAVVEMWGDLTKMFDTGLFEKQANKMNGAFTRLKTTVGAIVSPLYTIASNILTGIANGINTALEGVVTIYGYLAGLVGATGAISRNATEWSDSMEDATAAADAGLAAFDKLTTIGTEGMGDEAQAQRIRDLMADAAESGANLRGSIKNTLAPLAQIGNAIANFGLDDLWVGFVKAGTQAWATMGDLFDALGDRMRGVLDKVVDGFKSMSEALGQFFTGVWSSVTAGFKTVANSLIKMFNKVIGAYNSTLGRMNFSVLGYNVGLPTIGEIPMLAQGGIAEPNDPFLAVLGDNRKEREFITPESTMRDVVRSVIEEQGGVRQTIEIPISLDGRVMARATYDYYSREAKRRGATWY